MHVVIAKTSNNPRQASQRLQSTPLYDGLKELGVPASMVVLGRGPVKIAPPSHIVVHYYDNRAIADALELRKARDVKLICLCADVYDLAPYRRLAETADLFLVPTPLHRQVIQSAVSMPVAVLSEAVDPIALPRSGPEEPVACNDRLCWFGYPESFDKSMRYLLPDAFALSSFNAADFTIISAAGDTLWPGAMHKVFSQDDFYHETSESGYALLSHFAHDLHLNSFIKSPNKMITAIVRGMVPLVSATPAYRHIAHDYGLEALMFDGPMTLSRHLKALSCERDRTRFGFDHVRQDLLKIHSPAAIARRFLELVS